MISDRRKWIGVIGDWIERKRTLYRWSRDARLREARTSRGAHPSLDVRLFRDPPLSSAAAAIVLNFFAMAGVYFFMSIYRQNVCGYSPLHAGLLTTPVAIGQLVAASRSARLVRRFGAKVVTACGLLLVTGHALRERQARSAVAEEMAEI